MQRQHIFLRLLLCGNRGGHSLGLVTVKDIINVHDSGVLINPMTARAQVHGGMSMGLGYALSEELLVDERQAGP